VKPVLTSADGLDKWLSGRVECRRIRQAAFDQAVLDDLTGLLRALAALITGTQFLAQLPQIVDALFPDSPPDLAIGDVLADADVHDEIPLPVRHYPKINENDYQ
jgi:hypothetical protein